MIGTRYIIKEDVFDVSSRIKEIDPDYFIVRNYKTEKFELHAKNKRGGSLCLVLPYERLDARTLTYARRTRSQRAKELMAEVQAANKKLNKQRAESVAKKAIGSLCNNLIFNT